MPLTLGPRNVRDDRGKVVTGRSINELLGDVRVDAGKRRFSWRMIGRMSVWSVLSYLYLSRVVYKSIQSGGVEAWIFAALAGFVLVLLAWDVFRAWSRGSDHPLDPKSYLQSQAVANELVAACRCGACGYGLRRDSPESDGCIVCSECGAAWLADKVRVQEDAAELATKIERALKISDPWGVAPRDVQASLLAIATHKGRTDGKPAASLAGAAVAEELGRTMRRTRMLLCLWFGGVGAALISCGVPIWALAWAIGPWMTGAGLTLGLVSLCIWGTSDEWKTRKAYFLSYRVCPACLAELRPPHTPDKYVTCPHCSAVWLAKALGSNTVSVVALQRVNIPCTRCGYNRNGLADNTPCPECGLGAAVPPGNPHCAACDTPLESPTRVCPRCMYQAGVDFH